MFFVVGAAIVGRAWRAWAARFVLPSRTSRARVARDRDVAHVVALARMPVPARVSRLRVRCTASRIGSASPWSLAIGAIGVIACGALFVCTAMIYACLRFLQEWATPLTMVNFVLLGCASGFTLATACAAWLAPSLGGGSCGLRVHADARGLRDARRVAHAQCALAAEIDGAKRDGHQGAERRAEIARLHGGRVQSARVLPRTDRPQAIARIKWTFLVGAFGVPFVLMLLGDRRVSPSALFVLSRFRDAISRDSSPNAGSSSPKRGIRRTCITRGLREATRHARFDHTASFSA